MSARTTVDLVKLQGALTRWVTDETHHGVFATDDAFRIVLWNRWMEMHTGYTAGAVAGRDLFELYPQAAARGREYYEQAIGGRVTVLSHGLHRFLLSMPPSNEELPFAEMPQSARVGPLLDDGRVIGVITIIEDVSDRLASEAELRKQIEAQQLARATAERALRAKDEFLSTLSHEIRTPLNAVLGWSRILLGRKDVDAPTLDRAMRVIERNAAAQAKMIDDLLDMARIVAGKLRVEMHPVDLMGIVLAAIDVIRPAANAKSITIRTSLDPTAPRVLGDPDRLQQVVWNLLSNAVKFMEPGGVIDVRLDTVDTRARIVVADTGQGISPEFLPYVFDRFRQDDSSSARRHGGLGLGLSLVRDLVELHGGAVRATSEGANRGATFTIELPTLISPETRQNGRRPGSELETAPSLAGVRVLVVDDELDSRELAVTALRHRGALVSAVDSVAEALAALSGCSTDTLPHVIVSDIGMPREDGYALMRQIRSLPPARGATIPAISVTGYATPEDIQRALSAGYRLHMSKPIDPSALVAAVARLTKPAGQSDESH